MPKQTLSVSDEDLKWHADKLPPTTVITEGQAARLLGVHPGTLRVRRRVQSERLAKAERNEAASVPGHDLLEAKQVAHRHGVRYLLGDVLREAQKDRHVSKQARDAAKQRRESGWMGFGTWLSQASLEDTWTFTVIDGLPIDFGTSLEMAGETDWEDDREDIRELTLGEYLRTRLLTAQRAESDRTAAEIEAKTFAQNSDPKACERCGRPLHSGPCRL